MLIHAPRWTVESRKNSSKIIKKDIACRQSTMRTGVVTPEIQKMFDRLGGDL